MENVFLNSVEKLQRVFLWRFSSGKTQTSVFLTTHTRGSKTNSHLEAESGTAAALQRRFDDFIVIHEKDSFESNHSILCIRLASPLLF